MTAALDLGSSEFRSLHWQGQRLLARRLPAIYTVIDDSAVHQRLLEQAAIPFSVAEGTLIVLGEAAIEVASLLSVPVVPLLMHGELPGNDPIARQVTAWMIESLLPQAQTKTEICQIVLPRGEAPDSRVRTATAEYLEHVVQLRGYRTESQPPVLPLALSELEDCEFTGACLTIGAESTTLGITHQARPIFTGRYLKGSGDLIERFAHAQRKYLWDQFGNSYLNLAAVRERLQADDLSLSPTRSEDEVWLKEAYEELLLAACFSLKRKLNWCEHPIVRQPIPLVVSGGACRLQGLGDVILEAFKLSGLPLKIRELRWAMFDPYSIARGLLIQGTLMSGEALAGFPEMDAA